ncbi:hypothetical protein [Streptomyces sp. NPDC020747]|uniref:hypothetical protein n=1 Tax=Streptomyces sp. NPDC020747 TaxID=3365086 RepID=UPI0037A56273
MTSSEDILAQIDNAVEDWTVSVDAVRSRPGYEPRPPKLSIRRGDGEWQELEGVASVGFGPEERVVVITVDATEAVNQIRRFRERLQAWGEAAQPQLEEIGRALDALGKQAREAADGCVDCPPPRRRDRPAWQSPYGPARPRR